MDVSSVVAAEDDVEVSMGVEEIDPSSVLVEADVPVRTGVGNVGRVIRPAKSAEAVLGRVALRGEEHAESCRCSYSDGYGGGGPL